MKNRFLQVILFTALPLLLMLNGYAAEEHSAATESVPSEETEGYRIDQPGTITFTVGVKISGKVEKPQVMIFLPKEKTLYRDEKLTRSFSEEIQQPIPFSPITE